MTDHCSVGGMGHEGQLSVGLRAEGHVWQRDHQQHR